MSREPRTRSYWTDGVADPHSLLGRSKLNELILGYHVSRKQKVEMRHVVVWNFHLRNAHRDYAWTSLVSERQMVADIRGAFDGRWGLARQHIRRAHDELVDWKILALAHKGGGKGDGSRYWPNFDLLEQAADGRFPHKIAITLPQDVVARYGCEQPKIATGNYAVPTSEPGTTLYPVLGTTLYPVKTPTGNYVVPEDPTTRPGIKDPGHSSCIDISAPVADGLPATAPDDGFDRLVAAYAKPGDNLVKARRAFDELAPNGDEIERMITSARSWRSTANGKRMALARWIEERRWLSNKEFANDNRPSHRFQSSVVTSIKARGVGDDFAGAKVLFCDRDGDRQTRLLDEREFRQLQSACVVDRPAVSDPSDDLHEFVGARFQLDPYGNFDPFERVAAA